MSRKPKITPKAFTLLETVLALGLAAMVIVVALVTLRHISSMRHRLNIVSELNSSGRYLIDRLHDDLANIHRPDPQQQVRFSAANSPTQLTFQTTLQTFDNPDSPACDLYQIQYQLEPSPQNPQSFLLTRTATPITTPDQPAQSNRQAHKITLASNIQELTFEFYDGTNWLSSWNKTDRLPRLIRTSLTIADTKNNLALPFTQTVNLNPLIINNPTPDPLDAPLPQDNLQ